VAVEYFLSACGSPRRAVPPALPCGLSAASTLVPPLPPARPPRSALRPVRHSIGVRCAALRGRWRLAAPMRSIARHAAASGFLPGLWATAAGDRGVPHGPDRRDEGRPDAQGEAHPHDPRDRGAPVSRVNPLALFVFSVPLCALSPPFLIRILSTRFAWSAPFLFRVRIALFRLLAGRRNDPSPMCIALALQGLAACHVVKVGQGVICEKEIEAVGLGAAKPADNAARGAAVCGSGGATQHDMLRPAATCCDDAPCKGCDAARCDETPYNGCNAARCNPLYKGCNAARDALDRWAHSGALGSKSQAGALQSAGACRVLQHVAPRCNMSHRVATRCRHLLGL
jgi:hypothetical protein